jgi:hypothetical protein
MVIASALSNFAPFHKNTIHLPYWSVRAVIGQSKKPNLFIPQYRPYISTGAGEIPWLFMKPVLNITAA